ncbi:hypothetical protein D3C75_1195860 [compost metagenome]
MVGQADTAADAFGQGIAHTFFQFADLVADGAAGQVQFPGRDRHAAKAGYRIQRAQGCHGRKAHTESQC